MENITPTSEELTRSNFAAMGGVLVSRSSGVLRTIIVNATFGAATALDAFNAAFRVPNSLRDLFADGALSAAFMAALVDQRPKGHAAERELIAIVLGFFITITLLLAFLGVVFAEPLIDLMTDANFKLTGGVPIAAMLFQLLIFYLPLTMINAVIMAVLGVHGKAFRAMNGSLFLSVGMIIGALVLGPLFKSWGMFSVTGLAVGALAGAILQMIYQMLPLFEMKLIPWPNFNVKTWLSYRPLRKILTQMTPRALGQGAMVIALAINTYFATMIGTGFLTYIVTAVTIIQVPIGLFGVATGFAALPALMTTLQQQDTTRFSRLLTEGLKTSFWLATVTTICFALLIVPFYVVLFQHGKITYVDTIHNSIAICMYSTGIILASGNKVLINILYTLNATRQIIYNAIIYLAINTGLNFLLVPKFGVLGIGFSFGLATSLDFYLNYFTIKYYYLRQGYSGSPYQSGGSRFTQKIIAINLLGFLACFLGVVLINSVWSKRALSFHSALVILVTGGVLITAVFLIIMKKYGPAHLRKFLF